MKIKYLILISSLTCSASFTHNDSALNPENPNSESKVGRGPSSIVHSFDRFTFLESIASGPDGTIYGATHIFDNIIKITLQSEVLIIA